MSIYLLSALVLLHVPHTVHHPALFYLVDVNSERYCCTVTVHVWKPKNWILISIPNLKCGSTCFFPEIWAVLLKLSFFNYEILSVIEFSVFTRAKLKRQASWKLGLTPPPCPEMISMSKWYREHSLRTNQLLGLMHHKRKVCLRNV